MAKETVQIRVLHTFTDFTSGITHKKGDVKAVVLTTELNKAIRTQRIALVADEPAPEQKVEVKADVVVAEEPKPKNSRK